MPVRPEDMRGFRMSLDEYLATRSISKPRGSRVTPNIPSSRVELPRVIRSVRVADLTYATAEEREHLRKQGEIVLGHIMQIREEHPTLIDFSPHIDYGCFCITNDYGREEKIMSAGCGLKYDAPNRSYYDELIGLGYTWTKEGRQETHRYNVFAYVMFDHMDIKGSPFLTKLEEEGNEADIRSLLEKAYRVLEPHL